MRKAEVGTGVERKGYIRERIVSAVTPRGMSQNEKIRGAFMLRKFAIIQMRKAAQLSCSSSCEVGYRITPDNMVRQTAMSELQDNRERRKLGETGIRRLIQVNILKEEVGRCCGLASAVHLISFPL